MLSRTLINFTTREIFSVIRFQVLCTVLHPFYEPLFESMNDRNVDCLRIYLHPYGYRVPPPVVEIFGIAFFLIIEYVARSATSMLFPSIELRIPRVCLWVGPLTTNNRAKPTLPVKDLFKQIIEETNAEYILTTGTCGRNFSRS